MVGGRCGHRRSWDGGGQCWRGVVMVRFGWRGRGRRMMRKGGEGGAAISRRCRRKTCERIRLQSSLRKGMINERVLHKYLCPSKLNVVI